MIKNKSSLLFLFFCLFFSACEDTTVTIPEGAFDEPTLDLQGSWSLTQVSINGVDISDRMDIAALQLTLNMDSSGPTTFEIQNGGIAFLTTKNGNWIYDDKAYPTSMKFTADGEEGLAMFNEAPISTGNKFSIRFSLGCADNTYIYNFKKQ